MKDINKLALASLMAVSFAHNAFALEDAPVDRNNPGPYLGLNLNFGQAQKAGGSSGPGAYWNAAGEMGYVFKRDTWNRIEVGLELGTGGMEFKDRDQINGNVSIDLKSYAMFKAGYGYSLGGHAFGVWRLGAGLAFAELDGPASLTDKGNGITALVGWDAVFPASEKLHLIGGFNLRYYNFNWDKLDSFQVNVPAIYGAVRIQI